MEGKKSFVLYIDILSTVEKLPHDKIGKLFLTILEYVNDKDPKLDDIMIDLVFEPIKQQLKRDLIKWKETSSIRSEIGKIGGIESGKIRKKQKEANEASALKLKQKEAKGSKRTVSVNVNDSVNENVKKDIKNREDKFIQELKLFLSKYSKEMLNEFFFYWGETNKTNTKMKFEQQSTWNLSKRLTRWANNNQQWNKNNGTSKEQFTESDLRELSDSIRSDPRYT